MSPWTGRPSPREVIVIGVLVGLAYGSLYIPQFFRVLSVLIAIIALCGAGGFLAVSVLENRWPWGENGWLKKPSSLL